MDKKTEKTGKIPSNVNFSFDPEKYLQYFDLWTFFKPIEFLKTKK